MNFEKVADTYLRNLSDRKFPHLFCEHDVFIVKDHWRLYQREFVDQNRVKEVQTGKVHYIDYYWSKIFKIPSSSGDRKYTHFRQ